MMIPDKIIRASENAKPRLMVVYGEPKMGKSTIIAGIENCLVIDLKNEYDYLNALKVKVTTSEELSSFLNELATSKERKWNVIAIDNATWLYDLLPPIALKKYRKTPAGKGYEGELENIPFGGSFYWLRVTFVEIIDFLRKYCDTVILVCHQKNQETPNHVVKIAPDLVGKLSNQILGDADTVARICAKKNERYLDFEGGGSFIAQSRIHRLRGKVIKISEEKNGVIETFWKEIFN